MNNPVFLTYMSSLWWGGLACGEAEHQDQTDRKRRPQLVEALSGVLGTAGGQL